MSATPVSERLARHALPQSVLHTPLFAGVEAPILGFEVVALGVVVQVVGLSWGPLLLAAGLLGALHVGLAAATARDRRLALVFSRSLGYPRYARPSGSLPAGRGTRLPVRFPLRCSGALPHPLDPPSMRRPRVVKSCAQGPVGPPWRRVRGC